MMVKITRPTSVELKHCFEYVGLVCVGCKYLICTVSIESSVVVLVVFCVQLAIFVQNQQLPTYQDGHVFLGLVAYQLANRRGQLYHRCPNSSQITKMTETQNAPNLDSAILENEVLTPRSSLRHLKKSDYTRTRTTMLYGSSPGAPSEIRVSRKNTIATAGTVSNRNTNGFEQKTGDAQQQNAYAPNPANRSMNFQEQNVRVLPSETVRATGPCICLLLKYLILILLRN